MRAAALPDYMLRAINVPAWYCYPILVQWNLQDARWWWQQDGTADVPPVDQVRRVET